MKSPSYSRFAVTIFLSAFLLFQIQPLIARYILPWFGGGPSVWTACMLFFELILVAGYAYAHVLSRLSRRRQVVVHLALLLLSLSFLPVVPSVAWKPAGSGDPTVTIMLLLLTTIGMPFFLLSASSPLIQSWFSRSAQGASPYHLFALSNAGSLLALVTYPTVVEPTLFLRTQAEVWSGGYVLFAVMAAYCALRTWSTENDGWDASPEASAAETPAAGVKHRFLENPSLLIRVLWAALPACGSVILLAVTNQLCWDVAVVPFLWVLPLALYLLSFILSFHNERWYRRAVFKPLMVMAVLAILGITAMGVNAPMWLQVTGFSAAAFVCFMVCHGETARLKPSSGHLTLFYLLLAVGGAAGGIFVGLMAPRMFDGYAELYIGLWACCLLSVVAPRAVSVPSLPGRRRAVAMIIIVTETLLVIVLGYLLYDQATRRTPGQLRSCRNFYGVLKVMAYDTDDAMQAHNVLQHGRITHGLQFTDPKRTRRPTTYYGRKSGLAVAIRSFSTNRIMRVGIIGLGTGTIAAYGRPGDDYRFYEINPMVIQLSNEYFTYLRDSRATCTIVTGDARTSMENEPARKFDVIAVDAFTSDAIPVHLLTREAMLLYLQRLRKGGIIALHISNRYLDLEPVANALAHNLGLHSVVIDFNPDADEEERQLNPSTWVLLAVDLRTLKRKVIRSSASRSHKVSYRACPVWTDDYNNLFTAFRRKNGKESETPP